MTDIDFTKELYEILDQHVGPMNHIANRQAQDEIKKLIARCLPWKSAHSPDTLSDKGYHQSIRNYAIQETKEALDLNEKKKIN